MAHDANPKVRDEPTHGLRSGYTTGSCAAAAAKAALLVLCGRRTPDDVDIPLPDGTRLTLPIENTKSQDGRVTAAVRKDAGDDPDVTDGVLVKATVEFAPGAEIVLAAGDGVGTITKPGLAVAPGEPAINPVPRRMIREAAREATDRGVIVTLSIPGGKELAEKTFNPRLGVRDGLSILGTSGIVRPFSSSALRDALKCSLEVARACEVKHPVFVPGRIGARAAQRHFAVSDEQLIEVSNEWGFMLDAAEDYPFDRLLALGHPGKLAKLAGDQWDTHSKRSHSAVPLVAELAGELFGRIVDEADTVEAVFHGLTGKEGTILAERLSYTIVNAISGKIGDRFPVSVVLVNLGGEILGSWGELEPWRAR